MSLLARPARTALLRCAGLAMTATLTACAAAPAPAPTLAAATVAATPAASDALLAPWRGPFGGVPPWNEVSPDRLQPAI